MEQLIPSEWFQELPVPVLLLLTVVSIVLLVKGADWLVEGAAGMAYRLGMPKVIVGATIVSLGTTSPECAVSVMAAWGGAPGLALGNAVGSIIADSGLIFGLGCVLAVLPADRFVLSRQGWVQFGSGFLLASICYASWAVDGPEAVLGRWVGVLFLGLLLVYLAASVRWSGRHPQGEPFQAPEAHHAAEGGSRRSMAPLVGLGLVGLGLVVVGSHVLIEAVSELARQMRVPEVVIAATLVAFGTSLPELVVGITSLRRGHPELLVGNVIGADILNVLFVVGASAAAAPLPMLDAAARIPEIFLRIHLPTMLLVLVLFRIFIHRAVVDGRFRRWMGFPLLLTYVGYVVLQYAVS